MLPKVLIHELTSVGKCLISSTWIQANQVVLRSTSNVLPYPTTYTVQFNEHQHCNVHAPLMYTSHSCRPNARITFRPPPTSSSTVDTFTVEKVYKSSLSSSDKESIHIYLVALHDISPNNLVSFDYCTSEWRMTSPFPCSCGAPNCRGIIEGYESLLYKQPEIALSLLPYATPFIQQKTIALLGTIYDRSFAKETIKSTEENQTFHYLSIQELLGIYSARNTGLS